MSLRKAPSTQLIQQPEAFPDPAHTFRNGNAGSPLVNNSTAASGQTTVSDVKDISTYARRIRTALGRSAFAILETAAIVAEARDALDRSGFRELADRLGLSHGTLCKLVAIDSRRDRFVGQEESLPSAWTVLYRLSRLPDEQFEILAASGKLQPKLSERQVSKFVVEGAAADDITRSASDEQAYLAAKIVFPALLSEAVEDGIRRRIIAAVEDEAGVTVKFSERQKLKAGRR
jgi:hypothetical protein